VFPTVHEPELAPEGKHIALCLTQFGAYELRGRTWEEEREAYGKRVIRTLGGSTARTSRGPWRRWRCWPPPDIEERFGLLGGNIFQGEMTPDQLFPSAPISGYGDYRTPVKGLYLCGSANPPRRRGDGGTGPERGTDGPARAALETVLALKSSPHPMA
jgi:phytoene dehydrogenase-like protein